MEEHLLNKFLAPYRTSHVTDANQTKRAEAIVSYTHKNILPVLTPGLIALARAVEADPSIDDVATPDPEDDLDLEMQSMELKIYLAKNVNKSISDGLEKTFRAKPADPLDHLASYFFSQSADEVLNPEFDDQVNPLQFLGQYLMRHNPMHIEENEAPPPPSNERLKQHCVPPVPTLSAEVDKAGVSLTDGKPHVYMVPDAMKGFVSADCEKEVVGVLERSIPNIGAGGADKHMTITAIRHIQRKTVLFRAIDTTSFKRYDRILNDEQLRAMCPAELTKENGLAAAVQNLLQQATLVRVARGLQISFENTPKLATPPPTLFQTSRKFDGRLFIIDVISEPPLATSLSNQEEQKQQEDYEWLLLRCRVYDPEYSRYYEAATHDNLPRDVKERREKVQSLVDGLEIVEFDEHTKRPMRFGFPSNQKKESKEESKDDMTTRMKSSSLKKKFSNLSVNNESEPLSSPRLRNAFKDAKAMDGTLPLSSITSSSTACFSKEDIDARESVWQLRRDHALLQKRERLQKRVGGGGRGKKRKNNAVSVIVFRKGIKVSKRRMIVSVECFNESVNGTLRITAYDPGSSEAFEAVVQHRDTRGMIPGVEGVYLKGDKDKEVCDMCKGLQLVKGNLILFEKDEWLTKLRQAFDALPKDFTGRASRGNVLDLLRDTKKIIVEFLAGMHDPMNEYVMGYLDRVVAFAEVNAWPMVSFEEFKVFLDKGEGEGEGEGGIRV
ncbi:hypothetical protein TL16_g01355 [Triparma laevis f. inornata]|uniref:Uncharacterized protein n=1 Tax=Triparma laevis f. inornata TaxID=1714386 RepID=A0A9W7DSU4_9STRA|nr:hypothetical protein TL16_g01355 [Triparma laevis f. inornata]